MIELILTIVTSTIVSYLLVIAVTISCIVTAAALINHIENNKGE